MPSGPHGKKKNHQPVQKLKPRSSSGCMTRAKLKARERQQPIVLKKKRRVSAHLEKKKRGASPRILKKKRRGILVERGELAVQKEILRKQQRGRSWLAIYDSASASMARDAL
jgi:hypothetical protein